MIYLKTEIVVIKSSSDETDADFVNGIFHSQLRRIWLVHVWDSNLFR